jgi:hypothetical protein
MGGDPCADFVAAPTATSSSSCSGSTERRLESINICQLVVNAPTSIVALWMRALL